MKSNRYGRRTGKEVGLSIVRGGVLRVSLNSTRRPSRNRYSQRNLNVFLNTVAPRVVFDLLARRTRATDQCRETRVQRSARFCYRSIEVEKTIFKRRR